MTNLIQDLRFGFRLMRRTPGFTLVTVLVLAVTIGGTTAMFSLINALVFRPLPVEHPERLVRLYSHEKKAGGAYRGFSYPNFLEMRERNTAFSSLMAFSEAMVGVSEGNFTRRCFAVMVSTNYFSTLGVRLAAGRGFLPEEERAGSAVPAVIVSHSYWRRAGADPGLVGKSLRINSRQFEIIGVAPEYFTGTMAVFAPDFWFPLGTYEQLANDFANQNKQRLDDRNHHCLRVVGRLKAGVTFDGARSDLALLAGQLEQTYPEANKDYTFDVGKISRFSINTYPNDDRGPASLSVLVMAMSGAVLLIACLNLANMMLARAAARKREIAIRLSLGSSRARLVRQLLVEGMLLALLGGAAGLMLSSWATQLLVASAAPRIPFLTIIFDARPDWRVLLATFCACLTSVLVFGLGPAWRLSRTSVTAELKEQVGDELLGKARGGLLSPRNLLVVAQLGLSLALLTSAGLFARGAIAAARANPGFSLDKNILVETDASLAGYAEPRARQLYLTLLDRLRGLPNVQAASFAYVVPFSLFSDGREVVATGSKTNTEGQRATAEKSHYAGFNIVATDYFKTLGLPLLRGREFAAVEMTPSGAAKVAIIDDVLANRLWPGENSLGRQVRFKDNAEALEIVGVVPGVRDQMETKTPEPHIYVPFGQEFRSAVNLHVRLAAGGPAAEAAMLKAVQETLHAADPQLAVLSVQTLRRFHEDGLMVWMVKTVARLFGLFGAMALFLAVVGVYGVKAYVVARRTREIGIRIALGATRRDVLWMVLREGLTLTAAGVVIGMLLAVGIGFAVRSVLYGVEALDPLAFTVAPLSLAAAALIACYIPARRATRIQPMAALRYE